VALTNYKAFFRTDFKPQLGLYQMMFPAASALSAYDDWIATGLAIRLQNFDVRCILTRAHNFFSYSSPSLLYKPKDQMQQFARSTLERERFCATPRTLG